LNNLITKLKFKSDLSHKSEEFIISIAEEIDFSKGSLLQVEGQKVINRFYFTKGFARSFKTDQNAKE